MHGYSTDSDEKRVVPLFLAGLAIAFAWVSSYLLAIVHFSVKVAALSTRPHDV